MMWKDRRGFTGLEAAIVLIAFVVVAAVFSYVMLGAGFFTTQKGQQVVATGVEQASSSLTLDGQYIYIKPNQTGSTGVADEIYFYVTQTAGGTPVDLNKTVIVYKDSDDYKQWEFGATFNGTYIWRYESVLSDGDNLVERLEKFKIILNLTAAKAAGDITSQPTTNEIITIEVKPPVGAPLTIKKQLPPSFQSLSYV